MSGALLMFVVLAAKAGTFRSQRGGEDRYLKLDAQDWFVELLEEANVLHELHKEQKHLKDARSKNVRFARGSEPLRWQAIIELHPGHTALDRERWSRHEWFLSSCNLF